MKQRHDKIEEAKKLSGAPGCVECGRCVAACPMAEMYVNFGIEMSPRGIIKKTLIGDNIVEDKSIWYCTECNSGTDACPQGVSCRDLIRKLREAAIEENLVTDAKQCELLRPVLPRRARGGIRFRQAQDGAGKRPQGPRDVPVLQAGDLPASQRIKDPPRTGFKSDRHCEPRREA